MSYKLVPSNAYFIIFLPRRACLYTGHVVNIIIHRLGFSLFYFVVEENNELCDEALKQLEQIDDDTGTVQYSTVQYRPVQYSKVQYSTVQYSTHRKFPLIPKLHTPTS